MNPSITQALIESRQQELRRTASHAHLRGALAKHEHEYELVRSVAGTSRLRGWSRRWASVLRAGTANGGAAAPGRARA